MSYSTIPRKSPLKVGKGVPSRSQVPKALTNHKWEPKNEVELFEVHISLQEQGVRPPYGSAVMPHITKKVNKRLQDNNSYVATQVFQKISYLKDLHRDYNQLKN